MERYQHVVRFGLQGHVHTEFFVVSNSMSTPSNPVMVHSVAGSLAPIYKRNPSFMTLDLDSETLLPINKGSHYFNLTQANAEGTPTWMSHDYLEFFNLTDLSPTSMMNLALRVKNDKEFAS